jgi:MYXO-CTERM domain-containing protein
MLAPKAFSHLGVATLLGVASLCATVHAQTTGANATHDPSRLIESNGRFYFCSTGGACASSANGLAWTATGLHLSVPSWSTTYMSGGNQGVWAPDVIFFNAKYYIYYSFCGVPGAGAPCVIGLYTTPTLDSTATNYRLTDAGMVVNNPTNTATYQFSTIDPAPIIDLAGSLWTAWGSGYGKDQTKTQLWITRLDTTGLPLTTDAAYAPPTVLGHALLPGRKEGSYVHYHGGNYYLFYNEGRCCSGTASDYTIWVARGASLTGPFTGDKIFYASSGNIHGPGHMGIYSACGVERFTYHYYPTAASVLGENELSWSADGWPVAGPPSATPLTPCGGPGSGGAGGAAGTSGAGGTNASGGAIGSLGQGGSAGSTGFAGGSDSIGDGGAVTGGLAGSAGDVFGAGDASTAGSSGAATIGVGPGARTPSSTASNAGCGCSVPGNEKRRGPGEWLLVAAGAALANMRRRK